MLLIPPLRPGFHSKTRRKSRNFAGVTEVSPEHQTLKSALEPDSGIVMTTLSRDMIAVSTASPRVDDEIALLVLSPLNRPSRS